MEPKLEQLRVEPAHEQERAPIAALLYESASGLYERLIGDEDRALRVIDAALAHPGNGVSLEVVRVARVEGEIAGVIATFPVSEARRRARRFMRLARRRSRPTTWRRMRSATRLESSAVPPAPADAMYVDALATAPRFRRRGVALALLAAAEDRARAARLPRVALITELHNDAARALYRRAGFVERELRSPAGGLPGFVALAKPVA